MPKPNKEELALYLKNHTNVEAAGHFGVSIRTIARYVQLYGFNYEQLKYGHFPPLTRQQNDLITASLLGDGCISARGRFSFKQKLQRKEYVLWLSEKLKPYSKDVSDETGIRRGRSFTNSKFLTAHHTCFKELRKKWYPVGRKMVPRDLVLTPEIFAHWHVQDGTNNQRKKSVRLATDGFCIEDVKFLIRCIERDFGLKPHFQLKKGKYPIIDIGAYDYNKAIQIVFPHITWGCFQYKISTQNVPVKKMINGGACKLNKKKAHEIRVLFTNDHVNVKGLAERYGVAVSSIYNVLNNQTYSEKDTANVSVVYNPKQS